MFGDEGLQALLGCRILSFTCPLELEQHDGLDHVPEAGHDPAQAGVQEALGGGGLGPAGHHHIAEAGEQGMCEVCAQDPLGDQPVGRPEDMVDLRGPLCGQGGHVQGALAVTNDNHALSFETFQRGDIPFGDDVSSKQFLIHVGRQVLAIRVLPGGQNDKGEGFLMDPFLISNPQAPPIRFLGHAQDLMLETQIKMEAPDGLLQVSHDLLPGGMQVWLEGPVKIGEVVLGVDILQIDPGIGRCPHTADLFMLLEHNRREPVPLEHAGSGDARNACTDDRDP